MLDSMHIVVLSVLVNPNTGYLAVRSEENTSNAPNATELQTAYGAGNVFNQNKNKNPKAGLSTFNIHSLKRSLPTSPNIRLGK